MQGLSSLSDNLIESGEATGSLGSTGTAGFAAANLALICRENAAADAGLAIGETASGDFCSYSSSVGSNVHNFGENGESGCLSKAANSYLMACEIRSWSRWTDEDIPAELIKSRRTRTRRNILDASSNDSKRVGARLNWTIMRANSSFSCWMRRAFPLLSSATETNAYKIAGYFHTVREFEGAQ